MKLKYMTDKDIKRFGKKIINQMENMDVSVCIIKLFWDEYKTSLDFEKFDKLVRKNTDKYFNVDVKKLDVDINKTIKKLYE